MSNRIRMLEASDVAQAHALSQAVGWNQTPADWQLAIEMNPQGCFAMEVEDQVVATTTTIRYGTKLAWIGMVLTHPEFRARGYARSLMHRALDHLSDIETIKLDATDQGAPLYRQLGFVEECGIERWTGQAKSSQTTVQPFTYPDIDEQAFGANRRVLLNRLSKIESASLPCAYAMGRGNRIGPIVSQSKEAALILTQWFLSRHPHEQLVWDIFPENNQAQSQGFQLSRALTRMTRGRALKSSPNQIYAGAGFEFG
jgi:GNAT superfamily N-acetyltransferase